MRSPDVSPDVVSAVARSSRLRNEAVLVTGATGFVGSNLALALLHGGARLHIVARATSPTWRLDEVINSVSVHRASLTDADALARAFDEVRPRVVLHLATPRTHGEAHPGDGLVEATVIGVSHVLRLSRRYGVERVIVTGSSLEYKPSDAPLAEHCPLEPVTIHGMAKAAASLLCQQAARDSGTPVTVLRLFHVYGPRESRHRLLPSAIRASLCGLPLPLTAGDAARDWIHVDDVIDAIVRAVDAEAFGEIVNVGSGLEYSNQAVVAEVARATGRPLHTVEGAFAPRADHAAHRRADRDKAARILGWAPGTTLVEGVARTVAWYMAHPSALSHDADRPPTVV